jgi:tetratricopeptide (TPR) repeat protein
MRRTMPIASLRAWAPVLLCTGAVVLCGTPARAADAEGLCREGKALKDAGRLEAAAAAYREAIRLDAECEEAYWGLGWVYRKQGLTTPAAAAFRAVVEMAKDPVRRREAQEALERMGAAASAGRPGGTATAPPPPPQEPSLTAARELVGQRRQSEALRMLRALIAADEDRAEAERLMREVKRERRLVRVRAAADPVFRALPDWETRLRARFDAAAGELSRQLQVDFDLVDVKPWDPTGAGEGVMGTIEDLQRSVSDEGVDIVVGFVAERREAPPQGSRLEVRGYTLGLAPCFTGTVIVAEVVASRDGVEWRMPEASLRENLTHELGHLFGAVHVTGDSVMRAEPGGVPTFEFDALNLEVMRACRWVDFRAHFASLDRDELTRLAEAYQRLADGPAADDGVHFYRAVALTFLDRYDEAIQEYLIVLKTSWQDAYTHLNLAELYERVGDLPQARTHWTIAATLGKPAEVADLARKALERTGG